MLKQFPVHFASVRHLISYIMSICVQKVIPSAPREDRFAIFVAGDNSDAKAIVSRLIEDIGFAPVNMLFEGRWS